MIFLLSPLQSSCQVCRAEHYDNKIVWEKLTEESQSEKFGNHSTDLSLQGHSAYEDITSSQNLLWEDSCFNLLNPVFNQTYLASLFLFI